MSAFHIVLMIVGTGLLLLGSFSGIALFTRSLKVKDKFGDETNVGSLWGLFILGLCAGLVLIWWALP
jgi:hypothetical protein